MTEDTKLARIVETILIIADVPVNEVKKLALDWYAERHIWHRVTLEDWLNNKGFKSRPFAFIPRPLEVTFNEENN